MSLSDGRGDKSTRLVFRKILIQWGHCPLPHSCPLTRVEFRITCVGLDASSHGCEKTKQEERFLKPNIVRRRSTLNSCHLHTHTHINLSKSTSREDHQPVPIACPCLTTECLVLGHPFNQRPCYWQVFLYPESWFNPVHPFKTLSSIPRVRSTVISQIWIMNHRSRSRSGLS